MVIILDFPVYDEKSVLIRFKHLYYGVIKKNIESLLWKQSVSLGFPDVPKLVLWID